MSNYLVTDTELTAVADAIRTKGGTSLPLTFPTGFINAINDIPSGGGNYTVTVSLTNPVNPGEFSSCTIQDLITYDSYETGDFIGSISSANGSTSVESNSSSFGILVTLDGASISTWGAQVICTGGVSLEENDGYGSLYFNVTGNGTITIDGVDYDD